MKHHLSTTEPAYVFYAWWIYFPQSAALAECTTLLIFGNLFHYKYARSAIIECHQQNFECVLAAKDELLFVTRHALTPLLSNTYIHALDVESQLAIAIVNVSNVYHGTKYIYMYLCIYIYTHTYTHTYVYILYIYTYIYIYIIHTYIHAYIHAGFRDNEARGKHGLG